jgi:hypothetical protein
MSDFKVITKDGKDESLPKNKGDIRSYFISSANPVSENSKVAEAPK